jgi:prenyltransferase beta subunit
MDWVNETSFITSANNKNIHIWRIYYTNDHDKKIKEMKFQGERIICPMAGQTINFLGTLNNLIGMSNSHEVYFWDMNKRVRPTHIFRGENKELIKG